MFAPRQQLAASELVRVARPGATIAVTAWTPDGVVGQNFRTVSGHMPPPPPELKPPVTWGQEDHVRSLFAGSGGEVSCERLTVEFRADSPAAFFEEDERMLGPTVMAKAALEAQGTYDALRSDMLALYDRVNEADDGSFRAEAEYLLTVVRVPG
jgi:hypothetical protein